MDMYDTNENIEDILSDNTDINELSGGKARNFKEAIREEISQQQYEESNLQGDEGQDQPKTGIMLIDDDDDHHHHHDSYNTDTHENKSHYKILSFPVSSSVSVSESLSTFRDEDIQRDRDIQSNNNNGNPKIYTIPVTFADRSTCINSLKKFGISGSMLFRLQIIS